MLISLLVPSIKPLLRLSMDDIGAHPIYNRWGWISILRFLDGKSKAEWVIRVESKFFRKTKVESDFWKMINRIDLADFIYETRPQVRFSSRRRWTCPCPVLVSFLSKFSGKSRSVSVCCPDSVWIFCPVSVCPDFRKKLSDVCLSGRTRTRQSCPDFHCPCPPTSDYSPQPITPYSFSFRISTSVTVHDRVPWTLMSPCNMCYRN